MATISIVIPLYNKGFIISETLDSVLAQTFTNFEIIIVNDGSTDNGFEIVSQFSDKRIKLFQQQNKGAAAARNLGIEKATGELIAFLDADDYWYPNHLEELFKLYCDFPNCGIYASRYFMKIAKKKSFKTYYTPEISNNFKGILPDYFAASTTYRVGLTSAIAIPYAVLQNNYLFNTKISSGQDLELFTKIAIEKPVAVTNLYTVEYNFSLENQLSKTPILQKKLIQFSQFLDAERASQSLKKFLDIYRLEYALQFRIAGDIEKSNFYLKDITSKIPFKTKVLLLTPSVVLQKLLKTKHLLKKYGIDFSVYH
jgi:glycosyltransferase involved in cell wall biosynthesis